MRARCLAFVLSLTFTAWAQEDPSSADIAAARALGQEGVKLADAGNCQDAIDRLARAEKLFHAPTTLGRLGECQVQVGKIVEGTENLNKVVRETLAPGAPAAFKQAQERAARVLAEAKPKIARLKIAVAEPSEAPYSVKVDGEPIPLASLNTNRPMDPGEHTIEAAAPGYKTTRAKVTLPEGGSDSVALRLEADEAASKPEPAATGPVAPPPPKEVAPEEDRPMISSRLPAYVAFGVGAAGVAVGSIFGLMALGKKGDLEDACSPVRVCPPSERERIDDGKTFGTVSTVGFVIGGAALVAGAALFFMTQPPRKTARTAPVFFGADRVGYRF
jgi:hypothetical protein